MNKLIYLIDTLENAIDRIIENEELKNQGLNKEKVKKTIRSFEGDELASVVFLKKYALRDKDNQIIEFTLEEAKDRWAKAILEVDKKFPGEKDLNYFRELYDYCLPAGRQMVGLGSDIKNITYSNCYVLAIKDDSIESIYETAKKMARTYSYGGGVGTDISILRPKNAKVSNSAKFSSGAVSFMELFSETTGLIGQSGRRGACLLSIDVSHPDIFEFIEAKQGDNQKIKNANISIKITDEFMNAVKNDGDFELKFKTGHEEIKNIIKARDLWDKIIKSAHKSAEPGLMFWSKAQVESPSDCYKSLKIHTSNPCSEILLESNDISEQEITGNDGGTSGACVLASLLLHNFVKNPYAKNAFFDFDMFKNMVSRAIRHLDNVVELNIAAHPLQEQKNSAILGRRIGLGMTGVADMLASLCIKFDSQEALDFMEKLMKEKMSSEYEASILLSKERGPFPLFNASIHYGKGFSSRLPKSIIDLGKKFGQRNVSISTCAPSGSISIIAHSTSGIEPMFCEFYSRFVSMGGKREEFKVFHPGVVRLKNTENVCVSGDIYISAHDVNYNFRINLQAIAQKYIDSSISSTINLPKETTEETVGEIYMKAWLAGLKGITVYREGSREGVLVTKEFEEKVKIKDTDTVVHCVRAEGGDKFYIMISYKDRDIHKPYQVFVMNYKKTESDSFTKIANSLIKMLKEKGVPDERIDKYIARSSTSLSKMTRFLSLSMKTDNLSAAVEILNDNAFAGTLAGNLYNILNDSVSAQQNLCPSCNKNSLRMSDGCAICVECGWSKCG